MNTQDLQAIVLAAGKSQRLNTGRSKLLEKICGQEMILYTTQLLAFLDIDTTLVVGHKKVEIIDTITKHHGHSVHFATQEKQLGTGHAVLCSKDFWKKEHILVMNGDMPLVSKDIIEQLYTKHIEMNAAISFVTTHHPEPSGYGRVVHENAKIKIVEAKDFTGDYTEDCCINAGIYLIHRTFLESYINQLDTNNNAQEFYLTDLVHLASSHDLVVETVSAPFDSVRGINTFKELWAVEHIKQSEIIEYWMCKGVRFSGAPTVHIDLNVTIGAGSHINQSVQLLGTTAVGKNCTIEPFCILENVTVKNEISIHSHTVIKNSHIEHEVPTGSIITNNVYIKNAATPSTNGSITGEPISLKSHTEKFFNSF